MKKSLTRFALLPIILLLGNTTFSQNFQVFLETNLVTGQTWYKGETYSIRMLHKVGSNQYINSGNTWYLQLFDSKGTNFPSGVMPIVDCTSHDCTISWTIPEDLPDACDYYILLRGYNQEGTHLQLYDDDTSPVFCIKSKDAPETVSLKSPLPGQDSVPTSPSLEWHKNNEGATYHLQVSKWHNFSNLFVDQENISGTSYTATNLEKGKPYWWRVREKINDAFGQWSDEWNFTTIEDLPPAPNLVNPPDNTDGVASSIFVTWTGGGNPSKYQLQVATDPNFTTLFIDLLDFRDTSYELKGLLHGVTYHWRVKAGNSAGYGPWSEVWRFSRSPIDLSAPNLLEPSNNTSGHPRNLTLKWESVQGATSYDLRVALNDAFTGDNEIRINDTPGISYSLSNLLENTDYFWKVKAKNSSVESSWSATWKFTTSGDVPSKPSPPVVQLTGPKTIFLTWHTAVGDKFFLYRSTNTTQNGTEIYSGSDTYYTDSDPGLQNGVTYYYRLRSENQNGLSEFSEHADITTLLSNDGSSGVILKPGVDEEVIGNFNVDVNTNDKDGIETVTISIFQAGITPQNENIRIYNHSGASYQTSLELNNIPIMVPERYKDGVINLGLWVKDKNGDDNGDAIYNHNINWKRETTDNPANGNIIFPVNNANIKGVINANGDATDPNGIKTIVLRIKQNNGSINNEILVKENNGTNLPQSQSWNKSFSPADKFSDGKTLIELIITDGINNEYSVDELEINWQRESLDKPSSGVITKPGDGETLEDEFQVVGTAVDEDGIEIITVALTQVGAGGSQNERVYEYSGGEYLTTKEWSGDINPDSRFKDGEITIGLWVKDRNGNDNGDAVYKHKINWKRKRAVTIYPKINISKTELELNEGIDITGYSFSANSQSTILFIKEDEQINENFSVTNNSNGEWSYTYLPMNEGRFNVYAQDNETGQITSSHIFVVKQLQTTEYDIEILYPANYNIKFTEGDEIHISFTDYMGKSTSYPINGIKRSYSYNIGTSYDGGITWDIEKNIFGEEQIETLPQFSITINAHNQSNNFKIKIIDTYNLDRTAEVGPFMIEQDNSDIKLKSELIWDYSFPNREHDLFGTAADGISRIYLKVFKENSNEESNIQTVSVTLTDGVNDSPELLGKILPASNINNYSEEANNIYSISAETQAEIQNAFWFWYVSPDYFSTAITYESIREVNAVIDVTLDNGDEKQIIQKIHIVRPPVMLVHGLGGAADSWEDFTLSKGRLIYDPRFMVISANSYESFNSFNINSLQLLPGSESPNSFNHVIEKMRKKGFASNQVYYIGHSMGGNILRAAIQNNPSHFRIGESSNIIYKNYNQGFVNRVVTLDSPFDGSPWADLFENVIDAINDKDLLRPFIIASSVEFPNIWIWSLMRPDYSGEYLEQTDALLDLKVEGGYSFTATDVPAHLIAGDIIQGEFNLPDIPDILWTTLNTSEEILQRLDKILNVAVAIAPKSIREDAEKILEKVSNKTNTGLRVTETIRVIFQTYSVVDFLFNSDFVASINSQLSNASRSDPNTTVFDNVWHSSPFPNKILKNEQAGLLVDNLLHSSFATGLFDNFHSSFSQNSSQSLENFGISFNSNRLKSPNVADSIVISSPEENTVLDVNSILPVHLNIADTNHLVYVKLYFQQQSLLSTERNFSYEFNIPVNGNYIDEQKIEVLAFYDYDDSTKIITGTKKVYVSSNSDPVRLNVVENVITMNLNETKYATYEAVYDKYIARLANNNGLISVVLDNSSIISYDHNNNSFTSIEEGETYAVITYRGVSDTLYFIVRGLNEIVSGVEEEAEYYKEIPIQNSLHQNYPNPFNPSTVIRYDITEYTKVNLVVYDILGRELITLVNEEKSPGSYSVVFDASSLSSGLYIYKITTNDFIQAKKMVFIK